MMQQLDVAVIEVTDIFGAKQDILVHQLCRVQSPTEGERALGWGAKLWMTGNPACSVQVKESRLQIRDLLGLMPVPEEGDFEVYDDMASSLDMIVDKLRIAVEKERETTDSGPIAVALYQAEHIRRKYQQYLQIAQTEDAVAPATTLTVQSIWRHDVRRTRYGLLGYATVQAADAVGEGDRVAVYLSLDGMAADGQTLWVRPELEFLDGRFTKEEGN